MAAAGVPKAIFPRESSESVQTSPRKREEAPVRRRKSGNGGLCFESNSRSEMLSFISAGPGHPCFTVKVFSVWQKRLGNGASLRHNVTQIGHLRAISGFTVV